MILKIVCLKSGFFVSLFLAAVILLLAACVMDQAVDQAAHERMVKECQELKQKQTQQGREVSQKELENRVGRLNLRVVEQDAQIKELEAHQASLKKQLDEAIQEVVRTKARLGSLESKAEAASNMAETEIALKAVKVQGLEQESDPELRQAEQLLKMSSQEFQKENYGGVLYLTSRAKSHIRKTQMRLAKQNKTELVPGEVLFALPLSLRVVKSSNIRQGPGIDFKVIATVKPNTPVTGYSYKGEWVRVKGENGLSGWIFQNLVSGG
jgi:hypothetical protein